MKLEQNITRQLEIKTTVNIKDLHFGLQISIFLETQGGAEGMKPMEKTPT